MRVTGLNVQYPISKFIASGEKTIETRTYKIPDKYLNSVLALIETPGKTGKFKARIIALIKVTECFPYANKNEFYKDSSRHLVTKESDWAWREKRKFGWKIQIKKVFTPPLELDGVKKGIVFTKDILI